MSRMKHRKRMARRRRLALITLALTVLLIAVTWAILRSEQPTADRAESLKAAIIDQLSSSYPNIAFFSTANSMFRSNGWLPYYYVGGASSDNVDFYRSLPLQTFKIIILRAHTALNPETETLALFTSEVWSESIATTKYLVDVMNGGLAIVRATANSTSYFGITPNFVKAMNGNFQNAIIIMMGCDGSTNTRMAEAFIEKGAKAYIGWNGPVSVDHTDAATQQLLKHLVAEKKSIATAITETIGEVRDDPTYGSTMSYYPTEAGQYNLP